LLSFLVAIKSCQSCPSIHFLFEIKGEEIVRDMN
jgi:hypothetical protein